MPINFFMSKFSKYLIANANNLKISNNQSGGCILQEFSNSWRFLAEFGLWRTNRWFDKLEGRLDPST